MQVVSFRYLPDLAASDPATAATLSLTVGVTGETTEEDVVSSVYEALKAVKASGYRTIVVSMADQNVEFPRIANAAASLGLLNGDFVWVWFGDYIHGESFLEASSNPNVTALLLGSLWLSPQDLFRFAPETDLSE
jgi:hypothetical protein